MYLRDLQAQPLDQQGHAEVHPGADNEVGLPVTRCLLKVDDHDLAPTLAGDERKFIRGCDLQACPEDKRNRLGRGKAGGITQ